MTKKSGRQNLRKSKEVQSTRPIRELEIQEVFDQLGIGDDASRSRFLGLRRLGQPEYPPRYRVVLTGSTAV